MAKLTADQMDPRNNLRYYTREALRNSDYWDDRAVRQEYSRLRDIAQKRLQRLAIAEPGSYAYKHNVGKYPTARGQSTESIREKLPELARFIAAKTGTVSGIASQRRKAVATLRGHGYTGITENNIKEFGEFMEAWRDQKSERVKGSTVAAEYFEWAQEREIPWNVIKDNFAQWLQQKEKLQKYVQEQEKKGKSMSADEIIARFDQMEDQRKRKNEKARKRRASRKNRKSE